MSCNKMLSKEETEWRRNRENLLRRYESTVIRMGSPRREAEIRKAEERGAPMHYDSHPARLETVIDILAHLNGMWQEEWLLAKEIPEYILRDKRALLDMGITLMPRLLGPNQYEEEGRAWWNVAKHGNDDPAQMGRIVAKQMSSGETLIEFWLGDFPDVYMFYEMRQEIEGEIAYTLLSRAKDAQKVSTSDREDMGGGEVAQASTEGDTAEPTPAGNGADQGIDWRSRLHTLRADARVRYQEIIEYWRKHPEKTEEQVARHFRMSVKTVQRAIHFRDGKE